MEDTVISSHVKFSLRDKTRRQIRRIMISHVAAPGTELIWVSKKTARKTLIIVHLN